jgi:hypothetical protein
VGGTFGVAVLGAMVSTLGRSKIDQLLPHTPVAQRAALASNLGSGGTLSGMPAQAVHASQQAFVYALQYGLRLGCAVALLGALTAWTLVGRSGTVAQEREAGQAVSIDDRSAVVAAAEELHV